MADERIDIEIRDRINARIHKKIQAIGTASRKSHGHVELLKRSLNFSNLNLGLQNTAIGRMGTQLQRAALEANKLAQSNNRVAETQAKATRTAHAAAEAQQKLAAARARAQGVIAGNRANRNIDTERLRAAQNATAVSNRKVAIAQNKLLASQNALKVSNNQLAVSHSKVAKEQSRAAAAAVRLLQAEESLRQSKIRTKTAAQQHAAAVHRTTTARNNARASAVRLEQAELRLANAQQRAASSATRNAGATNRQTSAFNRGTMAAGRYATRLQSMRNSAVTLARDLRGLAAFTIVFSAARGITGAIDGYDNLQNKLRNVTKTQEDLNKLTNEIFGVANRARVPVADLAKAFVRFDLAMQSLGRSQRESLALTETVSKLLTLNGNSAEESAAAMLQLSQAFSKGKLDGDEFRSVMELMPQTFQNGLIKTLGITRKELFDFSKDGKITADVLARTFANIAPEVEKSFSRMQKTLGQSLTQLGNNFTRVFGELNKSFGITRALARSFSFLSDNIDKVKIALAAIFGAASGFAALKTLQVVLPLIGRVLTQVLALLGLMRSRALIAGASILGLTNPLTAIFVIVGAIIGVLVAFQDEIKVSADGVVTLRHWFQALGERAVYWFNQIKKILQDLINSDIAQSIFANMTEKAQGLWEIIKTIGSFLWNSWVDGMDAVAASVVGIQKAWTAFMKVTEGQKTFLERLWSGLKILGTGIVFLFKELINIISEVIILGINLLIDQVNKIKWPSFLGGGSIFGDLQQLNPRALTDPIDKAFDRMLSDNASKVGKAFTDGFTDTLKQAPIRTLFNSIGQLAVEEVRTINMRARQIAEEEQRKELAHKQQIEQQKLALEQQRIAQLQNQLAQSLAQLQQFASNDMALFRQVAQDKEITSLQLRQQLEQHAIALSEAERIQNEQQRRDAIQAANEKYSIWTTLKDAIMKVIDQITDYFGKAVDTMAEKLRGLLSQVGLGSVNATTGGGLAGLALGGPAGSSLGTLGGAFLQSQGGGDAITGASNLLKQGAEAAGDLIGNVMATSAQKQFVEEFGRQGLIERGRFSELLDTQGIGEDVVRQLNDQSQQLLQSQKATSQAIIQGGQQNVDSLRQQIQLEEQRQQVMQDTSQQLRNQKTLTQQQIKATTLHNKQLKLNQEGVKAGSAAFGIPGLTDLSLGPQVGG